MSSTLKTSDSGGNSLIQRETGSLAIKCSAGSMNREDDVTAEELGPLATRAVDELIADVESGRFRETGRQLQRSLSGVSGTQDQHSCER
jgi:hypothetical protein